MTSPRRARYWAAVVCAAAVTVVGIVLASRSSSAPPGPAAAVLGYFGDLQRGDAAAALAAGRVPPGDRALLTPRVLDDQQRLAPISDTAVRGVRRQGRRAVVDVDYTLDFAAGMRSQHAAVAVRRVRGTWRVAAVAVATRLVVVRAGRLAVLDGRRVPRRPVLFFPGAVPVDFATADLTSTSAVGVPARATTRIRPVLSGSGVEAVTAAVTAGVRRCLRRPAVACPLPRGRVVPGSVRGHLVAVRQPAVRVTKSAAGVVVASGQVTVRGVWRRLTFRDRSVAAEGTARVPYRAEGYLQRLGSLCWRPA